jgi:hypothetical protein
MGTVPFREGESACAVYGDHVVVTQQTVAIQNLLSDQHLDHVRGHLPYLAEIQTGIEHIRCVTVRAGLHSKQRLELGRRRTVVTEHMLDLPTSPQATKEHQHASKAHSNERIGDQIGITGVVYRAEESSKTIEKVPRRLQARTKDR